MHFKVIFILKGAAFKGKDMLPWGAYSFFKWTSTDKDQPKTMIAVPD